MAVKPPTKPKKPLTKGEKIAAKRPGVGGKKPGLWPNVWKKRARQIRGK